MVHSFHGCAARLETCRVLVQAGAKAWFEKAYAERDGSAMIWLAKIELERRGVAGRECARVLLNEVLALSVPVGASEFEHEEAQQLLAKIFSANTR